MRVGILALQGAFREHADMLVRLGAAPFEIRQASDFSQPMDGLVLPGGESTVQGKLLHELGLFEPIREAILAGLPVFGTCAGLILLSERIDNDPRTHLATMAIHTVRNAWGRQLGSFDTVAPFTGIGEVPMTFIRAPYIASCGNGVTPLATVQGRVVAARQDNQLVTAFHPELTGDTSVHAYFLAMIRARARA